MSKLTPISIEMRPGVTELRIQPTGVRGADLYHFPWLRDLRGELAVGEFGADFPFPPKRYFIVSRVAPGIRRGEHAHRRCHQLLVSAHGSCHVVVDDGMARAEVILDHPSIGLHVSPMIWCEQHSHSDDSALVVIASEPYDPADYIRDYAVFIECLRGAPP
jgi:hypothetical protein